MALPVARTLDGIDLEALDAVSPRVPDNRDERWASPGATFAPLQRVPS